MGTLEQVMTNDAVARVLLIIHDRLQQARCAHHRQVLRCHLPPAWLTDSSKQRPCSCCMAGCRRFLEKISAALQPHDPRRCQCAVHVLSKAQKIGPQRH